MFSRPIFCFSLKTYPRTSPICCKTSLPVCYQYYIQFLTSLHRSKKAIIPLCNLVLKVERVPYLLELTTFGLVGQKLNALVRAIVQLLANLARSCGLYRKDKRSRLLFPQDEVDLQEILVNLNSLPFAQFGNKYNAKRAVTQQHRRKHTLVEIIDSC